MFKKYKWNFVSIVLIVSLIGFIILDLIFYHNIRKYLYDQTFHEMRIKTELALNIFDESRIPDLTSNKQDLYDISYRIRNIVNARVTIVDADGHVLADSDVGQDKIAQMDNHLNRPEIKEALTEGWGQSYRKSDTVGRQIFYTAYPIKLQGQMKGFLRLAYYDQKFDESMNKILTLIIGANLSGLIILTFLSVYFSHLVTAPILTIVNVARRIAAGDLNKSFPLHRGDEIGTLSMILNDLTEKLKSQISLMSNERTKLQDILTNLDVGVIVVDQHQNVIHANPKVMQILDLEDMGFEHKNILEIIRYESLTGAIAHTLEQGKKMTGEFEHVIRGQKAFFSYILTPFLMSEQQVNGVLIQLYNISEIKKLEAIRRDFVTNASHELKTPLTSIVAYTETLLEGASEKPEDRIRFIRRIHEQAQRLEFLIADLLKLSELEREHPFELKSCNLIPLITDTINDFKEQAAQKDVVLRLESPQSIKVLINEEGMRSALNNLIDNAIKYTPQHGNILVRVCESKNDKVKVEVIDNGIGIDPKYHERIFQRFYRIDKARSRALGGTGLGLAIVKHIIERHGSKIQVQSELGKGSNFWFELQKA